MDEVLRALADPSRRQLLDSLNDHDGQTLRELCTGLAMARQSVSKHLAVLEAAHLVTTERHGREKLHYLHVEPITAMTDRWLNRYDHSQAPPLVDFDNPAAEFRYTTYIHTTPQRLWQAITNPAYSSAYLGHAIESDWLKGSTYVWVEGERRIEDPDQVILETDPYERLALALPILRPDTAAIEPNLSDKTVPTIATERRSRMSFDIETSADLVKLTFTHTGFGPNSTARQLISDHWPLKLSNLKSGLEQV